MDFTVSSEASAVSGFKLEKDATSYASPYSVSTATNDVWIMGIVTTEMPANTAF